MKKNQKRLRIRIRKDGSVEKCTSFPEYRPQRRTVHFRLKAFFCGNLEFFRVFLYTEKLYGIDSSRHSRGKGA